EVWSHRCLEKELTDHARNRAIQIARNNSILGFAAAEEKPSFKATNVAPFRNVAPAPALRRSAAAISFKGSPKFLPKRRFIDKALVEIERNRVMNELFETA